MSSAKQLREGFSVPVQKTSAEEYAEKQDIQIVAEFKADKSAGQSKARAEFSRMVEYLKAHRCSNLLITDGSISSQFEVSVRCAGENGRRFTLAVAPGLEPGTT